MNYIIHRIVSTLVAAALLGFQTLADAEPLSAQDDRPRVRGAAYPQPTGELLRFPPPLLENASPPTHGFNPEKARSTAGVSIEWMTDSPWVELQFSAGRALPFGVYQNGTFTGLAQSDKEGLLKLQSNDPGTPVNFRLAFPNFSNPIFQGIEIDSNARLFEDPQPRSKVFVAVGDSITHGRGQDVSHQTWAWQVAEALDMELYNAAVGGSNANVFQIAPVETLPRVDLVSILWGYNDWVNRGKTIEEYSRDMNDAIDAIRRAHPEAVIAVMRMLNTRTEISKKTGDTYTASQFREAASELVKARQEAGDPNIFIIRSDEMTNLEGDLNDSVHLSPEGASKLAATMVSELNAILK